MFQPRPKQQEVLKYTKGRMAVLAVPGSGKTRTLSYLAARLVAEVPLEDDQEILVVTLVKSAVGHFARQVGDFVRGQGLLPGIGYRVRTLHSLANDIVRERPGLVALADDFTVIDEREADEILQSAVEAWVRANPQAADEYLSEEHFGDAYVRNTQWPDLVKNMAGNFIRQAKDEELSVEQVRDLLAAYRRPLPLAEICYAIYQQYESGLRYRGAVDFQDLIRLALRVLQLDKAYLERLQMRWPYILEDEAQDSSKLQEQILRLLTGASGNWVRVGDPNQAIYETFTTANPRFLRDFAAEKGVQARELPNSGRSTASIIGLANQLIRWSLAHPNPAVQAMQPLNEPFIQPTPPDDPQGNPPDQPDQVTLFERAFTSGQEREAIIKSLQSWLPENQDRTVAVLLPINASGATLVQALRTAGLPYVENLRSTTGTRAVVGALSIILEYLSDPKDSTPSGGGLPRVAA